MFFSAPEQDSAHDKQQQHRRNADARGQVGDARCGFRRRSAFQKDMPGRQADGSHQGRADDGGKFAHHVVETEEFRRTAGRDEAGIVGTAQGLDTALHQPHRQGDAEKFPAVLHEGSPDCNQHVDADGQKEAALDAPILPQTAKKKRRRKSHELHHQKGCYQVRCGESEGQAVVHRHADNGVHPVDIKPVGQQEKKQGFTIPGMPQGGQDLAPGLAYGISG